jgi:hypothetical protein
MEEHRSAKSEEEAEEGEYDVTEINYSYDTCGCGVFGEETEFGDMCVQGAQDEEALDILADAFCLADRDVEINTEAAHVGVRGRQKQQDVPIHLKTNKLLSQSVVISTSIIYLTLNATVFHFLPS